MCSSACPGHIIAKGVKVKKVRDFLTYVSVYISVCVRLCARIYVTCVYLGDKAQLTQKTDIFWQETVSIFWWDLIFPQDLHSLSNGKEKTLTRHWLCPNTSIVQHVICLQNKTDISRFCSAICKMLQLCKLWLCDSGSLHHEIISMSILKHSHDYSKQLISTAETSALAPQAAGRITSSMFKPKMTGERACRPETSRLMWNVLIQQNIIHLRYGLIFQ